MAQSHRSKLRKRAVAYARVSTVRQADRDLSIPDQLRHIREYCAAHNIELVQEFVEPGVSGREESRPEFQRMLDFACAENQPCDLILVHSFSRFARNKVLLETSYLELLSNGVKLEAITQPVDDTPEGAVLRSIIAIFDEYQSAQNSKHTHRAMCQCARDGFWPGAMAPDGYRKVPKLKVGDKTRYVLEPDPDRAPVIQQIFSLALSGDGKSGPMGVKAIAGWLNDRGHRSRTGGRWGTGTIYAVLTSTTFVGELFFNRSSPKLKKDRPREEWIPFPIEPLVSREVFDEVGRNLKAKAPRKTPPRLPTSPMLLTGILRCGGCGAAMTQMTGKGGRYVYYSCANRKRTGNAVCDTRSVPQALIEDTVCRTLTDRVLTPEHIDELVAACVSRARAQSDNETRTRKAQKALHFRKPKDGHT